MATIGKVTPFDPNGQDPGGSGFRGDAQNPMRMRADHGTAAPTPQAQRMTGNHSTRGGKMSAPIKTGKG